MPWIATADYVMIAVYMVLMVAIGVYFFRFIHEIRGYYAGGNQIPWWVAGVSFYMSGFSTYIFVAYAGRTYEWGWPAITLLWAVTPALFLAALVFARLWRRAGIITPVEFLETRYNFAVRQLFVWARIPVQLIDCGARVFALAVFVHAATGIGLDLSILLCGIITLSYTLLGGLWAVTVTDVVQFIVLIGITVFLVPMSISAAGGWSELVASLPANHLQLFNEHMRPGEYVKGVYTRNRRPKMGASALRTLYLDKLPK